MADRLPPEGPMHGEPEQQAPRLRCRFTTGPLLLLALACACLVAINLGLGPLLSQDSEAYVVLTAALARDHSYALPYVEATPLSLLYDGEGHNPPPWPPGYPWLAAALMEVSGLPAAAAARWVDLAAALLVVGLLLPCLCLRLGASPWSAAGAALVFAITPGTILLTPFVWSETTYMVALLVTLLLLMQPGPLTWRRALLLGLATAAACLVRYAGVALVLTVALCLLMQARRRTLRRALPRLALAAGLGGAGALAWFVRNRLVTGVFEAARAPGADSFPYNLGQAIKAIISMLTGPHQGKEACMALLALGMLALAALTARHWRQIAAPGTLRSAAACALVYVGLHAAWTAFARTVTGFEPIQIRYLWPALPALIAVSASLLQRLQAVSPRPLLPRIAAAAAVVGLLGCGVLTARDFSHVVVPALRQAAVQREEMSHSPQVQALVRQRTVLVVDTYPATLAALATSAAKVWYMSPYAYGQRDFGQPGLWGDWFDRLVVIISPTPLSLAPDHFTTRRLPGGAFAYVRR